MKYFILLLSVLLLATTSIQAFDDGVCSLFSDTTIQGHFYILDATSSQIIIPPTPTASASTSSGPQQEEEDTSITPTTLDSSLILDENELYLLFGSLGINDCDGTETIDFPPTISCGLASCSWTSIKKVGLNASSSKLSSLLVGNYLGFIGKPKVLSVARGNQSFTCVTETPITKKGLASLHLSITIPCHENNRVHDSWFPNDAFCVLTLGTNGFPSLNSNFTQTVEFITIDAAIRPSSFTLISFSLCFFFLFIL